MEAEVSESGKIYRNASGLFCFVCDHCGSYFDNVNETLEHIDGHFTGGTIITDAIGSNQTCAIENKAENSLDFIAISDITADLRSNLRVKDESKQNETCVEDWLEPSGSTDFMTDSIIDRKRCIHCSYCAEHFASRLFLVLHSEISHPNQPIEGEQTGDLQCEGCSIEFDTPTKLEGHFNQQHPTEVATDIKVNDADECSECKFCRRSFKAKHLLKRLLQRSTCKDEFCKPTQIGEFPFYCDICGHGFRHKFRLIHHMTQRHTGKEDKCKYCNQRYVLEASLRRHENSECLLRPNADENGIAKANNKNVTLSSDGNKSWDGYRESKNVQRPKMFSCDPCQKSYDTPYILKQHILSHSNLREFKCNLCDSAYNTKPRLRRHVIYNHTDRPTFDCEVCGWKFREKNNLKRHLRLHNGDYQAECQLCDKKFTANCHLKYHMNTAHSTETPYQCDLCGKSFNSTSKMNAHRRRHIKETLPCDICGKIFGSRNRLYAHKKTHTEERNIVCKVCGKNFKTAVVLRQHMYLHKGKIFSCNFCPMTFAQSSGRRTHEKLRHNIL
ncbi:zinc finger protein 26-like isoform X2 [Bradysia coprophila]|uniref:zinc finger protein 26-like isoform X2 n=1 Tax=Bradysia coprophila TaxID=38358 RepID=UPI00187DBCDD|nr:zinc finger protein 26-like isoform X2 [Bradysia coprophila]